MHDACECEQQTQTATSSLSLLSTTIHTTIESSALLAAMYDTLWSALSFENEIDEMVCDRDD